MWLIQNSAIEALDAQYKKFGFQPYVAGEPMPEGGIGTGWDFMTRESTKPKGDPVTRPRKPVPLVSKHDQKRLPPSPE